MALLDHVCVFFSILLSASSPTSSLGQLPRRGRGRIAPLLSVSVSAQLKGILEPQENNVHELVEALCVEVTLHPVEEVAAEVVDEVDGNAVLQDTETGKGRSSNLQHTAGNTTTISTIF